MQRNLYIIEARTPDGSLDLSGPQPENFFGMRAIQGIDEYGIAEVVFRKDPDAPLAGDSVSLWPSFVDPRFVARRKAW